MSQQTVDFERIAGGASLTINGLPPLHFSSPIVIISHSATAIAIRINDQVYDFLLTDQITINGVLMTTQTADQIAALLQSTVFVGSGGSAVQQDKGAISGLVDFDLSLYTDFKLSISNDITASFSNVSTPAYVIIEVVHTVAGKIITNLPGKFASDFAWATGAGNITVLIGRYNGAQWEWKSTIYLVNVIAAIVWHNLIAATDGGSGTLNCTSSTHPAGGSATKKIGSSGSYVEMTMNTPISNSQAAPIALCAADDSNYSWGTGAPSTDLDTLASVYEFSGTAYTNTGDTNGAAVSLGAVNAGDILRLEKSGNDVLVKKSTNGGASYTTLYTHTGVLSGVPNVYIKGIFAAAAAGISVKTASGFNLI